MLNLPGYSISEQIYESNNSLVYRGQRECDRKSVIFKALKQNYPTPAELTRYKQEYEITRGLNISGVIKAYSLEKDGKAIVIILEDFGGESLKNLMLERQFSLKEFIEIAIKITSILGEIHNANVIHKDINPSNIVLNPKTGEVKIIDFGISTQFSRETLGLKNPNVLEGTLPYMSPEQTGRMNRSLDYRTDYYSLGATFYQLLTNKLLFDTEDAMELVHCHLAKQPVAPLEINSEIPQAVSDIIMKLLAKMAEDRYQSAWGIKADLETCLNQLQNTGQIGAVAIASEDISNKFQIPQKLYGRQTEITALMEAFDRVASPKENSASNGKTEMMLVAGYSGIGKSVLVREIYRPITKQKGYFISGKFDQFQRNIPYYAVANAFSELVGQLLTETPAKLQQWREKLLAALGPNGQIIIDVIPEVESIIGKQPNVPELGLAESKNRFNLVFQKFIRVFSSLEHPLVIFLDDLQWADLATLNLIELIMTDTDTNSLLLIGAYRDNEVSPTHPLTIALEKLRKEGVAFAQITLKPLSQKQIARLIADTLNTNQETVMPLAELVRQKTAGNPFFVNEFLQTLYQENLLVFDIKEKSWQWNLRKIQAAVITDNVVELMVVKLQKLPIMTQEVLRLAACAGNKFDLNVLSIIDEKSPEETFKELLPAIRLGLILPTSELETMGEEGINSSLLIFNFKFLHDRIQQAAYASMDPEQKKALNLKIGRLLLANLDPQEREEKIFEITDRLNVGRELIVDEGEILKLLKLNLEAGKKAKEATAYAAAREYFIAGMEGNINIWNRDEYLALAFHKERAEVEYLNGNFQESEALINSILERAKSPIDKAEAYNLLITEYTLLTKYDEAIQVGIAALQLLEIDLVAVDLQTALDRELAAARENLKNKEIEGLLDEVKVSIPEKKIAIQLLRSCIAPAYFTNPTLLTLIGAKIVNLSVEYGSIAESSYGYATYGIFVGPISGDYQLAYQFGSLALKITEKFNDLALKTTITAIACNTLMLWKDHIKDLENINAEGYKAGLESGNLSYSGYLLMFRVFNSFYRGKPLEENVANFPGYLSFCRETQNEIMVDTILGLELSLLSLRGITPDKLSFNNEELSEEEFLLGCQKRHSGMALCKFHTLKSHILYLYDRPADALNSSLLTLQLLDYCLGHYTTAEHNFFYSLNLAALYLEASPETQTEYWQQLETNQKQMKIWADNCPENFQHKYLLVAAEIARIKGNIVEAMQLYKQAINSAKENEYIQHQALANELAAKFYLQQDFPEFANLHLIEARYGYILWGAKQKVEDLEKKYPQLLAKTAAKEPAIAETITNNTVSSTVGDTNLDLSTVMKAARAISGEIQLEKLLENLMNILLENAGARRGFLMLPKEEKLSIAAFAAVETDSVPVELGTPVEEFKNLPQTVISYVQRTQKDVVLNNAARAGQFTNDPYISRRELKSVLCTPIINAGQAIAILYLENNLTAGAFTSDRLQILRLLSSQAAISLENALLYASLEQKVRERTKELDEKNTSLEQTLYKLQRTQAQLIQSEKMSGLGQLVAGVAHEINNPIGFIYSNISPASEYVRDLLNLIEMYREHYPEPVVEIEEELEELDLEFLVEDLQKLLNSMKVGAERIRDIVLSLRNFSRLDESEMKPVNIHEGIDSTLLILNTRIKEQSQLRGIEIIKEYGNLPKVTCYASQINQVLMNIIGNAIDALEEKRGKQQKTEKPPRITIRTQVTESKRARLSIADNGNGMTEEIKSKVFDPFYTTKPVGSGTGLGLSVSYSVVVEKHGGSLSCNSAPGEGAEFVIEIPVRPV